MVERARPEHDARRGREDGRRDLVGIRRSGDEKGADDARGDERRRVQDAA